MATKKVGGERTIPSHKKSALELSTVFFVLTAKGAVCG
jgi:hypothetical protein